MASFFGLSLSLSFSLSLSLSLSLSRARWWLRSAPVYVRIPPPVPSVLTHYLLPSTLHASAGADDADAASFDEAQGLGIII